MKNLLAFVVVFALIPFYSSAQSNYKPGYILTLKGDTVKGFIDQKEWGKNPKQITFKSSLSSDRISSYSPATISEFNIIGEELYLRYTGKVSMDKIKLNDLSYGIDTTSIIDTIFLRGVTVGKNVSLFAFRDDIKDRYFIIEKGSNPVELIYHVYFDLKDQSKKIQLSSYKRQLLRLLSLYQAGDNAIARQIEESDYDQSSLQKIIYNLNGKQSGTRIKGNSREGISFFVGAGIVNNVVDYTSPTEKQSTSTIYPKLNLGFDLYLNKNVKRWVLRTELSASRANGDFLLQKVGTVPYTETTKFDIFYINLNPQLLYNVYNTDKSKFYLGIGAAFNFAKYSNQESYLTFTNTTPPSITKIPFTGLETLVYSITTKIGFIINNKVDIYAGYNLPTSLGTTVSYSTGLATYQAGVNFNLSKKVKK